LRRHELAANVVIELGDEAFRLKKSFEAADKMGARYILIVGENEVAADAFALKHLASGRAGDGSARGAGAADFADLEKSQPRSTRGSRSSPFLEAIMRGILLMVGAVLVSVSLTFSQDTSSKPISAFEQQLIDRQKQFLLMNRARTRLRSSARLRTIFRASNQRRLLRQR